MAQRLLTIDYGIETIEHQQLVHFVPRCHFKRSAAEELALSEAEGVVEWEKSGK
ncbi:MAG: hypothetical protein ACYSU5_23340 [Planctomycetota bacterium]